LNWRRSESWKTSKRGDINRTSHQGNKTAHGLLYYLHTTTTFQTLISNIACVSPSSELNAHVFHQGGIKLAQILGKHAHVLARADQWLHRLETGVTDLSSFECLSLCCLCEIDKVLKYVCSDSGNWVWCCPENKVV
jgi:hypothetical protein